MADNFRHMIGMLFNDPEDEGVIVFAGQEVPIKSLREFENSNEKPRTGYIYFQTGDGTDQFALWARENMQHTMEVQFDRSGNNSEITFCPVGDEPVTFSNLLVKPKH